MDCRRFEKLKVMVNVCPKLYFINNTYSIVLYTDASDYAHGAYLCQISQTGEGKRERNQYDSSVAHFVELKFYGRQSKMKVIQSILLWVSLATY